MSEVVVAAPHNRSPEELAMRALIDPELRRRYPTGRIVHELPLRYSSRRIDMATITESEIVSVEIKSSRDTMTRLKAQIEGFVPISAKVIVALAPKWNTDLPIAWDEAHTRGSQQFTEAQQIIRTFGGAHTETWTVCHETGQITPTHGGYSRQGEMPWASRMLDVLWVQELQRVAADHAVGVRATSPHDTLVRACHDAMTGRQVARAVCRALRARAFPWADAPIGAVPGRAELFEAVA